jgi:hypothetical protein
MLMISYYNQEVGVHILEQPCGQRWIVTRPCAIEMIEGSECELPVGNRHLKSIRIRLHRFLSLVVLDSVEIKL